MKFKNLLTVAGIVLGLGASYVAFAASDPPKIYIEGRNMLIAGFDTQILDGLTLEIKRDEQKSCYEEYYHTFIEDNADFDNTNPPADWNGNPLPIQPTPPLPQVIYTLHNRSAVTFSDSYALGWVNSDNYSCWSPSIGRAAQKYSLYLNYKNSEIRIASFSFEANFIKRSYYSAYDGVLSPILMQTYYDSDPATSRQLRGLGIAVKLGVPLSSSLQWNDRLLVFSSIANYFMHEQTKVLPVTVSVLRNADGIFIPCPNYKGQLTTNDLVVSTSSNGSSKLWTATIPQTMAIDTSIGNYGPTPSTNDGSDNYPVLVCQGSIRNSPGSLIYKFTTNSVNSGYKWCSVDYAQNGFYCFSD